MLSHVASKLWSVASKTTKEPIITPGLSLTYFNNPKYPFNTNLSSHKKFTCAKCTILAQVLVLAVEYICL